MLKLNIEDRDVFGKKLKDSRKQDKIPAILYGQKEKNRSLFVSLKDFKKTWKEAGESTVIGLEDDSKKQINVLIYDIAFSPLSEEPVHVDFYAVEMDKLINTHIPLVFTGVAPAVKELGGILVKVMHEVEVEALPNDLPHEINVNISSLKTFDDQITVDDLDLSEKVKPLAKGDEVIAFAELPKEEVDEEISIEDIEVAKQGKEETVEENKEEESGDQKK